MKTLVSILTLFATALMIRSAIAVNLPISTLPTLPGPSASPSDSLVDWNSTTGQANKTYLYDLVNLPPFQTEFSYLDPMTTEGDLIYNNSSPAPARLGIGTTGQILTVSGGLPVWANAPTGLPSPGPSGDVLTANGSAWIAASPAPVGVPVPSPSPSSIMMDVGGVWTPIPFPSPSPSGYSVLANGLGQFSLGLPGFATNSTNAVTAINISGGSNGSIPYQTGSGATSLLGIGSSTNLLTVSGGVPAWESIPTWNQNTSGTAASLSAALAASLGGTGINTSSSTGVPSVSSGTWSVAAQLATSLGGLGGNFGSSTGFLSIASGTVSAVTPYISSQSQGGSANQTTKIETPPSQLTSLGSNAYLVETGSANMLANPYFQASTISSGWTLGSGVTATSDTGTVYQNDPQSMKLTFSSASGDLIYQDVSVTSGAVTNVNEEQSLYFYNATTVPIQVCPRQNGSDIAALCISVGPGITFSQAVTSSVGGSSTTSIGISLFLSGTVTGTVHMARAYVGQNRNIGTVAQAQLWGTATTPGTSSCFWNSWTSTSYANATANSSCPVATVTGNASVPGSKIPGITFSSMPAGDYLFVANGTFQNNTTDAFFRFSDGTNVTNGVQIFSASTSTVVGTGTISGHLTYSSPQSNVTIQIQGATSNGSNPAQITAASTTAPQGFEILVYYFPTQSQAVFNPSLSTAWAANIMTGTASATTGNSSMTTIQGVTGRTNYGIAQTPGTSTNTGLTVNGLAAGTYKVMLTGSFSASGTSPYCQFQIYDGSGNGGSLYVTQSGYGPSEISGIFSYSSAQTTINYVLQAQELSGSSPQCGLDYSNSRPATFTIIPISQNVTTPIVSSGISTNAAGNWRWEAATFGGSTSPGTNCTTSTCTIETRTVQSLLSAATRSATGTYAGTFLSPYSSAPYCIAQCYENGVSSNINCPIDQSDVSTTGFTTLISSLTTTAAAVDSEVTIMCYGPR